jgi:hypothetical protein
VLTAIETKLGSLQFEQLKNPTLAPLGSLSRLGNPRGLWWTFLANVVPDKVMAAEPLGADLDRSTGIDACRVGRAASVNRPARGAVVSPRCKTATTAGVLPSSPRDRICLPGASWQGCRVQIK